MFSSASPTSAAPWALQHRPAASRERPEAIRRVGHGRLLILSPFPDDRRRPTVQDALYRNLFVAALADQILVAHAEPLGKTEQVCRDIVACESRSTHWRAMPT